MGRYWQSCNKLEDCNQDDVYLECVRCWYSLVNNKYFKNIFRKPQSNTQWCDCLPGKDFTGGWCVKADLKTDKKEQYIRIQNELLAEKIKLSAIGQPSGGTQFFISFTKFSLILGGSFIIFLLILLICRKCAVVFKYFKPK